MHEEAESSIPTYPVQQGEFIIALKLKGGELEAVEAENVVAPRVRGQLKIVEIVSPKASKPQWATYWSNLNRRIFRSGSWTTSRRSSLLRPT